MIVSEFSKPCEEITVTLTYKEVIEITRLLESVGNRSNLEKQFSALRVIIGGDSLDNLFLIGERKISEAHTIIPATKGADT